MKSYRRGVNPGDLKPQRIKADPREHSYIGGPEMPLPRDPKEHPSPMKKRRWPFMVQSKEERK